MSWSLLVAMIEILSNFTLITLGVTFVHITLIHFLYSGSESRLMPLPSPSPVFTKIDAYAAKHRHIEPIPMNELRKQYAVGHSQVWRQ